MCCCQAALLAGAPIPTPCHTSSGDDYAAETDADADHCCCDADASDAATESDAPATHDGLPCDSCPTCFGKPALGTTLDGGVRIDADAFAATLVVFIVAGFDGMLPHPRPSSARVSTARRTTPGPTAPRCAGTAR